MGVHSVSDCSLSQHHEFLVGGEIQGDKHCPQSILEQYKGHSGEASICDDVGI
jgi:hypothetical protein